ncbi:MAG: F420-dependent NADP oxidoreductase [Solirubrobacteraceae bacterium]|nr:F420-dependent NADP oxidoreductase [Solirubrobacteraceae bacterium]
MRIAVIGAGKVGTALGGRWSEAGHEVVYGVRDPGDEKHSGLPEVASVQDAATGADAILVALPWAAAEEALTGLDVGDAVVMDATNPLAASAREMANDPDLSGGELIRDWTGSSRVVKAFNTTGSGNMANPDYGPQKPMMPVAGDDASAKVVAIGLADEIGFDGVDAGPLSGGRDLEHMAMLWIRLAYPLGNGPDIAFALERR